MKFKKLLKLSAPVLALLLATACSDGQDEVNPDEEVNSDINVEEESPVNGDVETDEPASEELDTDNEVETEEPDSSDLDDPTNSETEDSNSSEPTTEDPALEETETQE